MEPNIANSLLNYGVLGIVVLVLSWVVKFLYKEMKADREAAQRETHALHEIIKQHTDSLTRNTDVLLELKRLFESIYTNRK